MSSCINLEKCGFVEKYKGNNAMAVKGFIRIYCEGDMQTECIRKKYKAEHGCPK